MNQSLTKYERTGECDGCNRPGLTPGQCCTYIQLPLARPLSPDERKWVELHPGITINETSVRIETACSALTEEGRCSLYGLPERPLLCATYPQQPFLDEGCSYQFKEITWQEH